MGIKFANNASAKLTGSVTASDTQFLIDAAKDALFPTIASIGADFFYVTLEDANHNLEVVKIVQHVSGSNTLNCSVVGNRGLDGTTAKAFAVNDVIEMRPNKLTLEGFEEKLNKDASGGYAGLTLFKLNLRNAANTITSWFTNANTIARTYTLPDKDGTVAMTSDINDAVSKTTPVDADLLGLVDSAAGNVLKRLSWANLKTTLKAYFDTLYVPLGTAIPSGAMLDFGGIAAPAGYLLCDGSNVSRATYAALFTAISTTWGVGDGSTTFGLPDFRRRAAVGSGGTGTATLGNAVGNTGGAETHTLTTSEIPAHTHTETAHTILRSPDGSGGGSEQMCQPAATASGSTGGGGAHNNMQPSAVVLKIIKT